MAKIMEVTIHLRAGTASQWATSNPILDEGEPGYETDTRRLKIGNGIDHWDNLPFFAGGLTTGLTDHINSQLPHPVYDDGPSLALLYENAKV